MRKRRAIVLAAGGRWPDATGGFGMAFNWIKIDNRGTASVDFSLAANPAAGDLSSTLLTVPAGECRVFNLAGPFAAAGPGEDWPYEFYLVSATGTTVEVEIADHPIVDMTGVPGVGTTSVPTIVEIQDTGGGGIARVFQPNADGQSSPQALQVQAYGYLWNGATWDRDREASAAALAAQSGLGAALAAAPGYWTVTNGPAAGTAASASKGTGAAGVRHIGTNLSFGFSASTALAGIATVTVNLRDGATGAGTVLKSWQFTLPAATVAPVHVELAGLSEVGTAATAMTLEFAAGVANLMTYANLGGYDAS
ncbi:MAG: hypothetical protein AUG49_15995 [Catenulispora sp. 13_1_20CM_3_70_7]|nr:MAG: hypothetical protein AUG49_15995 [Catenulispora sp. 13_1_20CM_3_70_7]